MRQGCPDQRKETVSVHRQGLLPLVIAQFAGIIMKKMLSHVRLVHPEVSSSISAYDNAFLIFMLPQSFITMNASRMPSGKTAAATSPLRT